MGETIRVALVNDYDVVVAGVARMLDPYRNRVVVAEIATNRPVKDTGDVALYDKSAQPQPDRDEVSTRVARPHRRREAVHPRNFHPGLVEDARRQGVHGYLSKALPARELADALEAVHAGEVVVSEP